jgi:hypothetical protein
MGGGSFQMMMSLVGMVMRLLSLVVHSEAPVP